MMLETCPLCHKNSMVETVDGGHRCLDCKHYIPPLTPASQSDDALVEELAQIICRGGGYGLCVGFCHTKRCADAIEQYGMTARAILPILTRELAAAKAAINDYNSVLRSCSQVAKRNGENTNWETLRNRVFLILEKHHATWLKHWDGKIS